SRRFDPQFKLEVARLVAGLGARRQRSLERTLHGLGIASPAHAARLLRARAGRAVWLAEIERRRVLRARTVRRVERWTADRRRLRQVIAGSALPGILGPDRQAKDQQHQGERGPRPRSGFLRST